MLAKYTAIYFCKAKVYFSNLKLARWGGTRVREYSHELPSHSASSRLRYPNTLPSSQKLNKKNTTTNAQDSVHTNQQQYCLKMIVPSLIQLVQLLHISTINNSNLTQKHNTAHHYRACTRLMITS